MTHKTIHIGLAIEEKLQELKMSKTEFGRRIGIPQQNVNRILEKDTIDTGRLIAVSRALNFNFFELYTNVDNHEQHTESDYPSTTSETSGDIATSERLRLLQLLMEEKDKRIRSLQLLMEEKDERIAELKERIAELKSCALTEPLSPRQLES